MILTETHLNYAHVSRFQCFGMGNFYLYSSRLRHLHWDNHPQWQWSSPDDHGQNVMRISQAVLLYHYCDVVMGAMATQITSFTIAYSSVYSGADQRKHQSSASLAFVRGIHRWPMNSPHKGSVTRKVFSFDVVIMPKAKTWQHQQHIFWRDILYGWLCVPVCVWKPDLW